MRVMAARLDVYEGRYRAASEFGVGRV